MKGRRRAAVWTIVNIRSHSGGTPITPKTAPGLKHQTSEGLFLALRLVSFSETLNLTMPTAHGGADMNDIGAALDAFARIGIGRHGKSLLVDSSGPQLTSVLRNVLAAIEESPIPDQEWVPLTTLLGDELVSRTVGSSISSVQRYRNHERPTPDDIAARLHTVALIVADLAGSYNGFGIRRWFQRPRSVLGGQAPAEVLSGDWSPDDESVRTVRDLARSLLGSAST